MKMIPIDIPNKKINYSPKYRNLIPGNGVEFNPVDDRVSKIDASIDGLVASPVVSIENNMVTATCATEGATIMFCAKDDQDTQFTIYSAPFLIGADVTLIFWAQKAGMMSSLPVIASNVYRPDYLRFTALQDGAELSATLSDSSSGIDIDIEYSLDNGSTWSQWGKTGNNGQYVYDVITCNTGEFVLFRGNNNSINVHSDDLDDFVLLFNFAIEDSYTASGNLNTLLSYTHDVSILEDYCFAYLFSNCTGLTTSPYLPATTLSEACYCAMFEQCSNLVYAPELPATTLAESCYSGMFTGCSSLTSAPDLPATILSDWCYQYMFADCSSLTAAPALPATTLAASCYLYMFAYCSSLTAAPELPATTLAEACYSDMFAYCSSLTSAPELPATTLANYCYRRMFSYCSSLTAAPALPATVLQQNCYESMFAYCSSLTSAPELPATTLASSCYSSMFAWCYSLTKAPELPATVLAGSCYSGMFSTCRNLTTAPELPATTLAGSCYNNMFQNCLKLSAVRVSATSWNVYNAMGWLANVSANGSFSKKAGTTIPNGNSGIPSGWSVINF